MVNHRTSTISSSAKRHTKPKKQQKTQNTEDHHCICDCPQLENIDGHKLLSFNENNTSAIDLRGKIKPFRTGKDPDSLISKRHFDTLGDGNKSNSELKLHRG